MKMSQTQKQEFLAALHVGVLSIPQPGKGPLTAPIWYDYEPGGNAWFIIGDESRKALLLQEGACASLCVQNEAPPYAYVSIEGTVSAIEACSEETLRRMAVRYLGEARGREYAAGMPVGRARVVAIEPRGWLAADLSRS